MPARQGTSALVVKDPENPYTSVSVYQSRPARTLETVGDYRDLLLDYLVSIMLNQRYAEVAQQADAPFLQARGRQRQPGAPDRYLRPVRRGEGG